VDSLGLAGGGGVVKDDQGNWVIGCARKIGPVSSFLAELWALRDGALPLCASPGSSIDCRDGCQSLGRCLLKSE